MNLVQNTVELNFEIEMTEDKLREILRQVENAKSQAQVGQVLRIKLNHDTILTFRNLAILKATKSVYRETLNEANNKPHESGIQ